jgi:uncharacterized membrane protein YwzB
MDLLSPGPFDLRVGPERVEITLPDSLLGPGRFVFDRARNVVERDAEAIFRLDEIRGVEVHGTWAGTNEAYQFRVAVVTEGNRSRYVCSHSDKTKVSGAAEAIAQLAGVQVAYREQPFQRQARRLLGMGTGSESLKGVRTAVPGCGAAIQIVVALIFFGAGLFFLRSFASRADVGLPVLLVALAFVLIPVFTIASLIRTLKRGRRHILPLLDGVPTSLPGTATPLASTPAESSPLGLRALLGRVPMLIFGVVFGAIGLVPLVIVLSTIAALLISGSGANRAFADVAWVAVIVPLVFTAIGGGFTWWSLRSVLLWRRLLREGTATEGTVLEIVVTGVRINRRPRLQIRYEYRDQLGSTFEGKSHLMSPEDASQRRPGDVGEIRFDPRQPELSMWVGTYRIRRGSADAAEDDRPREPSVWRRAATVAAEPPAVRVPPVPDVPPPVTTTDPHLLVIGGPGRIDKGVLRRSPSAIGRSIACEMVIDGDDRVTYQHARLTERDGVWSVEDARGSGGTYLNDERLDSARELRHGDVIRVGETQFRFEDGNG